MNIQIINDKKLECKIDKGVISAFYKGDEITEFEFEGMYFDRLDDNLYIVAVQYNGSWITLEGVIRKIEANLTAPIDRDAAAYDKYKENRYE